ncbi:scopoletin glucosyltransferase-like [Vitis riparia]|uniref:scopoletin glucosyltransferase-like n=1 Tax=Vitis riparia TaxID=96939 RepID=UPI00155A6B3A|nr:scopoletin glucosyltransferase-like [Vitis riparia]
MGSKDDELHVMFLPYMAPGHMMPLVDMARLFAAHGVRITIITTTMNALRFQNAIHRDIEAGRQIGLEILQFPSVEAGLPEGCENLISTPTPEMSMKLFQAIRMMKPRMETLLRNHRPDCIASDVLFHWTVDVAAELGIPRLSFSGSGYFNLCVSHCVERHQPHNDVSSETEIFLVPGLPDEIKLTRSQLPDLVKGRNEFSELFDRLKEAERKSFGTLMNSFYELEPAYADYYRNNIGIKAWHIGPVSLFNKDACDKAERGNKASLDEDSWLSWLDSKKPNSVLYVCLGSLTRLSKTQLTEIASALEDSGHAFIWVVGKVLNSSGEEDGSHEWWLPEGFQERAYQSGIGHIIRGWAPQVLILEHPAIGGFLTHCGWNSILEGVSSGLPMITWPIFAEQFYNEKLVTQVLKLGVGVGNEVWKVWATEEMPLMSREKIRRAVTMVMDQGIAADEMRRKASLLGELAKKAIEKGGSSYNQLKALIKEIRSFRQHPCAETCNRTTLHSQSPMAQNFRTLE